MLPNLGLGELIVILLIALILFGKRLPEVSRSLGKGIREFQRGMRGFEDEIRREVSSEPAPPAALSPVSPEAAAAAKGEPPAPTLPAPPPPGSGPSTN